MLVQQELAALRDGAQRTLAERKKDQQNPIVDLHRLTKDHSRNNNAYYKCIQKTAYTTLKEYQKLKRERDDQSTDETVPSKLARLNDIDDMRSYEKRKTNKEDETHVSCPCCRVVTFCETTYTVGHY